MRIGLVLSTQGNFVQLDWRPRVTNLYCFPSPTLKAYPVMLLVNKAPPQSVRRCDRTAKLKLKLS